MRNLKITRKVTFYFDGKMVQLYYHTVIFERGWIKR